MKRAALTLVRRSGVFAAFRHLNRSKVLILTYHRFSNSNEPGTLYAQHLVQHLEYLSNHYSILPLSEIANRLSSGKSLPSKAAVVTIDDGFRDAYEVAYPLMRKYQVPACLFVVTRFVDGAIWLWTDKLRYILRQVPVGPAQVVFDNYNAQFNLDGLSSRLRAADEINSALKKLSEHEKEVAIREISARLNVVLPERPPAEYQAVTWEQVNEMSDGGIEIGSHTVTHPILPNVDDVQLGRELRDSKKQLEHIVNKSVDLFCYPNGSYNRRVEKAVSEAGYTCAVTTEPRLNEQQSDQFSLARVPAESDMDHFLQSTSGFEQFKNRLLH